MNAVVTDPVVDTVLDRQADALGPSFTDYRNHAYRGMNYHLRLLGATEPTAEVALAWATHDIGIWTAGTWDYLPPSEHYAVELAPEFGIGDTARLRAMIVEHHKLRALDDPLVETFRLADRVDAFHGLTIGTGLSRADVAEVVEALPYGGFHKFLVGAAAKWTVRHPLRPLPMLRW
jgi:hypothetical protein